jgi:hypothetical protein
MLTKVMKIRSMETCNAWILSVLHFLRIWQRTISPFPVNKTEPFWHQYGIKWRRDMAWSRWDPGHARALLELACPSKDKLDHLLQSRKAGNLELARREFPLKFLAQGWSNLLSATGSLGTWIETKISTICSFKVNRCLHESFRPPWTQLWILN